MKAIMRNVSLTDPFTCGACFFFREGQQQMLRPPILYIEEVNWWLQGQERDRALDTVRIDKLSALPFVLHQLLPIKW